MQAEFGCAWEHNFLFDKNTVPVLGNNDDKQVPCAALHVYRANGGDALVRVRSQHVRASFLRIGNINSYSMKTQYLYWEPTTTNKYRAQPQVPLVSRHQREQTNKVPVAHATRWVRAQCGNLRCPKYHCLQSGKWGVFLQFDSAPILLGSGELFFSWGFSALIDAQLRRSTNETIRPTL